MGIVLVAFLAAKAAFVVDVTSTSTLRRTSSSAKLGSRSSLLSAYRPCSAACITFAVLTFAIAFANSIEMLGALRFLAGVGLGGAMPNAATLASEYVPRKQRPFAVTLTIVCIPLGGVLAGELAARIIPTYGWRALFIAGGIVPLVLAAVLWKVLPESPRYLASRRDRWPELTQDDAAYRARPSRRRRVRRGGTAGVAEGKVASARCSALSTSATRSR